MTTWRSLVNGPLRVARGLQCWIPNLEVEVFVIGLSLSSMFVYVCHVKGQVPTYSGAGLLQMLDQLSDPYRISCMMHVYKIQRTWWT